MAQTRYMRFGAVALGAAMLAGLSIAGASSASATSIPGGNGCDISVSSKGPGYASFTLWFNENSCGFPVKTHIWCNTWPGHNYERFGNVVGTGASKASCDTSDDPISVEFSYFENGRWYDQYDTSGTLWNGGSRTFYF